MAEFLVELYLSRIGGEAVDRAALSARRAAEQLTSAGRAVRYLRAIFVPDDESCFLLFEAAAADHVREAARLAALPFEHVSEVVADSTVAP
jgi:Protein of unknown function (DUF4242)